jgi:hypothetical protein
MALIIYSRVEEENLKFAHLKKTPIAIAISILIGS